MLNLGYISHRGDWTKAHQPLPVIQHHLKTESVFTNLLCQYIFTLSYRYFEIQCYCNSEKSCKKNPSEYKTTSFGNCLLFKNEKRNPCEGEMGGRL